MHLRGIPEDLDKNISYYYEFVKSPLFIVSIGGFEATHA